MKRFLLTLAVLAALVAPVSFGNGYSQGIAFAQSASSQPDYDAWEAVATRAENAVESGLASTSAFQGLRDSLAEWRAKFLAAQDTNASRIETIKAQISSLGAAPSEGETEPQEIAKLRSGLNDQLAQLQAPQIRAVEAYNRADGLIVEIDTLLRTRETARLLELGPTPLNPTLWPSAFDDLWSNIQNVNAEVKQSLSSDTRMKALAGNAPLILFLLAASILGWRKLPTWFSRLTERMGRRGVEAGPRLQDFADDLVKLAVRMAATIAIIWAVKIASLLGARGDAILAVLPYAALGIFAGPTVGNRFAALPGAKSEAGPIARAIGWLGLVWAASALITAWGDIALFSEGTSAVLQFPLVLIGGLLLWRLGNLVQFEPETNETEDEDSEPKDPGFRKRALLALRVLCRAAGVLSPVAAAAGYMSAAMAILFPTIASLALVSGVMLASALVRDVYAVIRRKNDEELSISLTPVLLNFVLVLAALPFGVMIWGVRPEQLLDLWTRFQEGFSLGETRVTPGVILTFAIIFSIGYVITRLVQATLKNSVLPKTKIEQGAQTAMVSGLGYFGIFIAAVIAISSAGINLSSLAIVAGALSVGIGFGLQTIVSNFVSGIILLIERPVAEGDWIEVGTTQGTVREISVRSTRIETFDRSDVIVPNADLISSTVTNYTRGNLIGRVIVPVGVAYGTDTKLVEKILLEIAEEHPVVAVNPPPTVIFQGFGADALEFEIRAILRDVFYVLAVKSDINHEIARRFAEANIEIPFAQRDIWLRNPEVLTGKEVPQEPKPSSDETPEVSEEREQEPPRADEIPDDPATER